MTKIICGFPGVGKTTIFMKNQYPQYDIVDLDSSDYNKDEFPDNYVKDIKILFDNNLCDFLLISTHDSVINKLIELEIPVMLVYPFVEEDPNHSQYVQNKKVALKEKFMERYEKRGSPDNFIKLMDEKFWEFANQLDEYDHQLITKRKLNDIIDSVGFVIWEILGDKSNGLEKSFIDSWEGWQDDGGSLVFYDAVLKKGVLPQNVEKSILDYCGETGTLYMTLDTERSMVEFSVWQKETDESQNWSFTVNLSLNVVEI